jgi:hypothetical protein
MKFSLKVLVLVGIIVISKWEKMDNNFVNKQKAAVSYPVYIPNTTAQFPAKQPQATFTKLFVDL